ncbi:MAG: ribonuclease H-like YkuK family protein [Candidatus Uhrbacteria bacterium]
MLFHSPSSGTLVFDQVLDAMCAYLAEDRSATYRITIGSDSAVYPGRVDCISAIVIHRVGRGGRYFWMRTSREQFHTLRERIWHEAICSTTLARSVLDALMERAAWDAAIEVHVDVGANGPTRVLIQEICGYVRAYGFVVHTKPEAYAAAAVADKYT